jgi:uncharacterized damage-inducible protein DinB
MNKIEILKKLDEARNSFLDSVKNLDEDELQQPGVVDQWSIKDILFHLTMWEAELVKMLWQISQDQTPTTIHFSTTTVDEANALWMEQSSERLFELVWQDFLAVRRQTIRRVEEFRDEDLNNPALFSWLNGQPLWVWIAEDSFGHEAEHTTQILSWRKQRGF